MGKSWVFFSVSISARELAADSYLHTHKKETESETGKFKIGRANASEEASNVRVLMFGAHGPLGLAVGGRAEPQHQQHRGGKHLREPLVQ